MDRVKTLLTNKSVVRAIIVCGVGLAGLALSPEQVDQIAGVVTLIAGLFD